MAIVKDAWITVQFELLDTEAKAEFDGQEQRIVAVLLQHTKQGDASRVVYGIQDPANPGSIIPVDFDESFVRIQDPKHERWDKGAPKPSLMSRLKLDKSTEWVSKVGNQPGH